VIDEREKRIILLVASFSLFQVPFTGSSITVALPAMLCFAIIIGPDTLTPAAYLALMTSVKAAFVVFTVLCILGTGASYVRETIHNE